MKNISLYEDKDTFLHHLHPNTKLLYIIVANLVPVLIGTHWVTTCFIILSFLFLLCGKVAQKSLPMLGFSFMILLTVIIIQGIFREGNVTPLYSFWGITFYREGLTFAVFVTLNVINILLSFAILVLTTKPSDMVEAFVQLGLSPKIGYVVSSVFQIIPHMSEKMATITDAQRSRGMETEGSLLIRLKAFVPLIAPVVMNSLIDTKERAIALEVRGFDLSVRKTFLHAQKRSKLDKMGQTLLFLVLILGILWRIIVC